MAGTKADRSTRGVVATAALGAGQCTTLAVVGGQGSCPRVFRVGGTHDLTVGYTPTGPYASSSSTLSFVVRVP